MLSFKFLLVKIPKARVVVSYIDNACTCRSLMKSTYTSNVSAKALECGVIQALKLLKYVYNGIF